MKKKKITQVFESAQNDKATLFIYDNNILSIIKNIS